MLSGFKDKIEILLVGCGSHISASLVEATRNAFSGSVVLNVKNIGEALSRMPAPGPEVIVLWHPNPDIVTKAFEAVDTWGLPRWAVVIIGVNPITGWVEWLPADELTAAAIPRVFFSAIEHLALRREIARARGDLLSIGSRVSHDLRTEAAAIRTNAELLRDVLSKEKPALAGMTEPIVESVDALGKIIERLSFLARVSVRVAAKKQFDMGHAVLRALQRMDPEIQRRRASMIQPNFWPKVNGEAASLEKVWCDLLANALTHARDQPRIELGWLRNETGHRFWISDDGVGIPLESQPQLFHPFHLMHRLNSPRGLGLTLVQRLIELQGGRCGYEPYEDGGSKFFFTLPT
jgi:signal transduction histidine kinase